MKLSYPVPKSMFEYKMIEKAKENDSFRDMILFKKDITKLFKKDIHSRVSSKVPNHVIIQLTGETGCYSGVVKLVGYDETLDELYKSGRKFIRTISLNTKRFNNPVWSNSEIIDSGKKKVFELEFEDGRKVCATKEHKFFRFKGIGFEEVELGELRVGDKLWCKDTNKFLNRAKGLRESRMKTFNSLKNCADCGDEFFINIRQSNKVYCDMCSLKRKADADKKNFEDFSKKVWLPSEDLILIKYYYSKSKKFILLRLRCRSWKQIQKRCYWIGLKRNPKFQIFLGKKLVGIGRMTLVERKMKFILEELGLKFNKDFFYNHLIRFEESYKLPDFLIVDKSVTIECDGENSKSNNRGRDLLFENKGFEVLHFSSNKIINDSLGVSNCIKQKLSL